jgi:hypothetical protein
MTLELVAGIVGVAFLIVYFTFSWDREEHWLLQLIASFFFIFLLILVPKAIIDNQDSCEIVVLNESTYLNQTAYTYGEHCETETSQTAATFHKHVMRFIYMFILYLFLYFTYTVWFNKIIKKFQDWKDTKKRK